MTKHTLLETSVRARRFELTDGVYVPVGGSIEPPPNAAAVFDRAMHDRAGPLSQLKLVTTVPVDWYFNGARQK